MRGLAVTGLVLSLLWVVIAIAIPVLLNKPVSRDASGSVTKAATMSPMPDLRAGDCFDSSALTAS